MGQKRNLPFKNFLFDGFMRVGERQGLIKVVLTSLPWSQSRKGELNPNPFTSRRLLSRAFPHTQNAVSQPLLAIKTHSEGFSPSHRQKAYICKRIQFWDECLSH